MNEEHKNALERSLHDICQDLDADEILPYLRSKEVIQRSQVQEIMKITSKLRQNMQLIDFITEADPSAFQEFINALHTCNKGHLAEKILARLPSSSNQQLTQSEMNITDTFNNQQNEGRMVGGPVSGGKVILGDIHNIAQMVVQGDYHAYSQDTGQAPSTSLPVSSQPTAEDWQQKLEIAQQSLKKIYLKRFKTINPFSLPFTFDIENTWVSLALKEEKKDSQATEDHAELLKRAFDKVKMLIIEGDPATGKTSLMRRLAYEWANEKQDLLHYDLLLYVEFREVREKTFHSITDLVLGGLETCLTKEGYENLMKVVNHEQFCQEYRILVLLDGYDESSLEKQCSEFSAYIKDNMIKKPLFFNTVITTRKGPLSNLRGRRGRFVFAEVLGFTTKQQKEKYIYNHFLSSEIDSKHNIAAVHNLLNGNQNLNKLAETPLFLTFICLVHERIIDGTILELYCNLIWWLIDRHQQDFPDRDIPALFGFENGSADKFETIQEHYLHFPQLRCLGNMALRNLEENVLKPSYCEQFSLQPIIEQVGLLRKERKHDRSFKLATSCFFPHRTIQEFLAAFYCFCSDDPTNEWLLSDSKLDSSKNEFERFLFRIALSDKMPVQAEKRKYYFDRTIDINLYATFDAFNTIAGFDNTLLNWFLSQCTNVQNIKLTDITNRTKYTSANDTSVRSESAVTSKMYSPVFSFSDLIKLHSVTFFRCTFSANSQQSFTNCPSLKNLNFGRCEIKSSTIVDIATLPAIDTVQFYECNVDLATWQSITDQISNSNVKCLQLTFGEDFNNEFLIHLQQCNNIRQMEFTIKNYTIRQNDLLSFSRLIKLHSLTFGGNSWLEGCIFSANSQLSITNCPSLKNLAFEWCEMKSSTIIGIASLSAIDTVEFSQCNIDLATWQSITDQISNSNVKYLHLPANFFADEYCPGFQHHLHKCERIQQIHVKDDWHNNITDFILNRYEESVTANLVQTAQKLPGLCYIILNYYGSPFQRRPNDKIRLEERNKERIEKAGQQRNPHFSIKYVEDPDSEDSRRKDRGGKVEVEIVEGRDGRETKKSREEKVEVEKVEVCFL